MNTFKNAAGKIIEFHAGKEWKARVASFVVERMAGEGFRDAADAIQEEDFPITKEEAIDILTIAGFNTDCVENYPWSSPQQCEEWQAEEDAAHEL